MAAKASFILSESQTALLDTLTAELEQSGLLWTSGYLAGLAIAKGQTGTLATNAQSAPQPAQPLTILYGSQTGNAKRVAEQLAQKAEQAGLTVNLIRANAYKPNQLKKETFLYVVISTHSEGDIAEAPDDAKGFVEFLTSSRAPKLAKLRYAVLALGDTSYPDFCGVGRAIDKRLEELGGKRLHPIGEADVDIDTVAAPWSKQALDTAVAELAAKPAAHTSSSAVVTPLRPGQSVWNRDKPFLATLLSSQRIVADGSIKDVHHLELSLENSGITYQPGDALGIWPVQSNSLVNAILAELQLDGSTQVTVDDTTLTLAEWLAQKRELTALTRPFIAAHAEKGQHADLAALLEPSARSELAKLLDSTQLIDLLRRWPVAWDAQSLVTQLRPLAPRMYSIASSQAVVEDEVHLTIEQVHYTVGDEQRWGVASGYLSSLDEGDEVPVFIDPNDRFRLPQDDATDILMIGPGTGVAPFRAFVQEREERGASGRNWLFFGNPHRRTDFLYQLEWQQALKDNSLHRLDVAFSRDQAHKIYVQDRLKENAAEVWQWLTNGAHLYVCGDAEKMAPDVHAALIDIIAEQGNQSREEASAWLQQLLNDGRYVRDVY